MMMHGVDSKQGGTESCPAAVAGGKSLHAIFFLLSLLFRSVPPSTSCWCHVFLPPLTQVRLSVNRGITHSPPGWRESSLWLRSSERQRRRTGSHTGVSQPSPPPQHALHPLCVCVCSDVCLCQGGGLRGKRDVVPSSTRDCSVWECVRAAVVVGGVNVDQAMSASRKREAIRC